jgi:hypothetical protein
MHDGDILTVIPPKPRILLVEDEPLLRGHLFRRRLPAEEREHVGVELVDETVLIGTWVVSHGLGGLDDDLVCVALRCSSRKTIAEHR